MAAPFLINSCCSFMVDAPASGGRKPSKILLFLPSWPQLLPYIAILAFYLHHHLATFGFDLYHLFSFSWKFWKVACISSSPKSAITGIHTGWWLFLLSYENSERNYNGSDVSIGSRDLVRKELEPSRGILVFLYVVVMDSAEWSECWKCCVLALWTIYSVNLERLFRIFP